ncbi:MAG TPA: SCO family protein, partial [Pyrinomonadaceae bacterium]|nr:SCO family protein [Pyrinomonadaceae bacterium]
SSVRRIFHAGGQRRKVIALLFCLFLASCQPAPEPTKGRRFDFKGTVVSVDKSQQTATISHEEVKGFMDAMTMPFKLKDAWPLDVMKPGDEVQATLVVTDTSAWLEDVAVVQKNAPPQTGTPEGSTQPQPGDTVPDFRLVNQDGKPVSLAKYKGKALLLTFIYTRCPVPEYCSLMSSNFAGIERELQKDPTLYVRTHLLSVSFDPAYDTPKVLRSYGAATTGNYNKETFAHWEFVTATPEEIKKMAQFFGLTYVPEKGEFVHSLKTALVAPDGKLFKLYSGNEWKPDHVLGDVRTLLGKDGQ